MRTLDARSCNQDVFTSLPSCWKQSLILITAVTWCMFPASSRAVDLLIRHVQTEERLYLFDAVPDGELAMMRSLISVRLRVGLAEWRKRCRADT